MVVAFYGTSSGELQDFYGDNAGAFRGAHVDAQERMSNIRFRLRL